MKLNIDSLLPNDIQCDNSSINCTVTDDVKSAVTFMLNTAG